MAMCCCLKYRTRSVELVVTCKSIPFCATPTPLKFMIFILLQAQFLQDLCLWARDSIKLYTLAWIVRSNSDLKREGEMIFMCDQMWEVGLVQMWPSVTVNFKKVALRWKDIGLEVRDKKLERPGSTLPWGLQDFFKGRTYNHTYYEWQPQLIIQETHMFQYLFQ